MDNGTALRDGKDEGGRDVEGGIYVVESAGGKATGVITPKR